MSVLQVLVLDQTNAMDVNLAFWELMLIWSVVWITPIQCAEPTYLIAVRLVDGPDTNQGRVEILYNNSWGTVCDDKWDDADARVVCKMMGKVYSGAEAVSRAAYGPGTGTILMDSVTCLGNETSLESCDFDGWGVNDCQHTEDAGVICQEVRVRARLVGGSDNNQGRIEVLHKGIWGTVCDDQWDNIDAKVACRMMSKPYSGAVAISRAGYGPGNGKILMDNVACIGNETSLESCDFDGWGISDCQHSEDAGVICQNSIVTIRVRLSDGRGPSEGRVEVQFNGAWGTICGDSFGLNEAKVICKQLGYTGTKPAVVKRKAYYGPGNGRVLLEDLHCAGTETGIQFCAHRGWNKTYCDHSEDASVICPHACRSDEFQCYDGRCISIDKIHDMTLDCADGSDEYDCEPYNIRCHRRHRSEGFEEKCRRITKDGKTCSSKCKVTKGNVYVCEQNNKIEFCHQGFCDIKSSINPRGCDFKASFCGWTIRSNASTRSWTSEEEGRVIEIVQRNISRTVLTSPRFGSAPYPLSIKYTVQKSFGCFWALDFPIDYDAIASPKWRNEECLSCEEKILPEHKVNVIIWTYCVGENMVRIAFSSVEYLEHLFLDVYQVCGQDEISCDGRCRHYSIINDGVKDCSNRKDEFGQTQCSVGEKLCKSGKCLPRSLPTSLITQCSDCEGFPYQTTTNECPAAYLCKQDTIFSDPICLRKEELCDGIPQCPYWDDENKCPIRDCPDTCSCSNNIYKCQPKALSNIPSKAPFIDISNHEATISEICSFNRISLVYLNLSRCGITDISCLLANNSFPNLKTLDASYNNITSELFVSENSGERTFILDGNHIRQISYESRAIYKISMKYSGMKNIQFRKVKNVNTIFINANPADDLDNKEPVDACNIQDINLSSNDMKSIHFLLECPSLRYLDLSSNSISNLAFGESNARLLELNLANNLISYFPSSLSSFYYLSYLNLSHNKISEIEAGAFEHLQHLKIIDFGNNRLKTIPLGLFDRLSRVEEMYLDNNEINNVDVRVFKSLITLRVLDISNNGILHLQKKTFLNMVLLTKLYMGGNDVAMSKDIYYGLSVLDELKVDKYSLCCVRPGSVIEEKCFSPKLSISSCQYLLKHGVLGISVWFITLFILSCGAFLIYRHLKDRNQNANRMRNILLHISIADFLFGICMFMISLKDVESKGVYGLHHDRWIHSIWCDIIRFLSFLCMEVTTLFSVLVTFNMHTTTCTRTHRFVWPSLWIGSLFIAVTCFVLNKFVITDSSALHHICLMIPLLYRNHTSDTWNLILTCFHTACVVVVVLVAACYTLSRKNKSRHLLRNNVIDLLVLGISLRNAFLCMKDLAYIIMETIPPTIPCKGLHEHSDRLLIVTKPGQKSTPKGSSKSTTAKGIQVHFSDKTGWKYSSRNEKVVHHVIICDAPAYQSTERNSEVKVEVVDMHSGKCGEYVVQYDNDASLLIQ